MTDTSQRTTRRGFLGTLSLAVAASAGCSGLGTPTDGQSESASGSDGSGSAAGASATDTADDDHDGDNHSHDDHSHGDDDGHRHGDEHAHGGEEDHAAQEAAAASGIGLFETHLREHFVDIESLGVEDNRVRLTYVTKSTRGHEIAAHIETVVVSFMRTYAEGWSVEGIDAKLIEPAGEEMGYWRTESKWVRPVIDGHETRTALLERTLDTYHGRLTRSHDHGGGGHSHDDGGDHEEGEDHHHDDEDGHSHDEDGDHTHDEG